MRCKKCGAKLKKGEAVCPKCGTAAGKRNGKKAAAIITACLLLVCAAAGATAYYFLNYYESESDKAEASFVQLEKGFTKTIITDEATALAALDEVKDCINVQDVNKELKPLPKTVVDGAVYYRFNQYYEGLPVYGGSVSVSTDAYGTATAMTSNIKRVENIEADLEYFNTTLKGVNNGDIFIYEGKEFNICKRTIEQIGFETTEVFTNIRTGEVVDKNCLTYTDTAADYTQNLEDGTRLLYNQQKNIMILNANKKIMECEYYLNEAAYDRVIFTGSNIDKNQYSSNESFFIRNVQYFSNVTVNDDIEFVASGF